MTPGGVIHNQTLASTPFCCKQLSFSLPLVPRLSETNIAAVRLLLATNTRTTTQAHETINESTAVEARRRLSNNAASDDVNSHVGSPPQRAPEEPIASD